METWVTLKKRNPLIKNVCCQFGKKKKGKSEIFVLIITEKKILKKADALE